MISDDEIRQGKIKAHAGAKAVAEAMTTDVGSIRVPNMPTKLETKPREHPITRTRASIKPSLCVIHSPTQKAGSS